MGVQTMPLNSAFRDILDFGKSQRLKDYEAHKRSSRASSASSSSTLERRDRSVSAGQHHRSESEPVPNHYRRNTLNESSGRTMDKNSNADLIEALEDLNSRPEETYEERAIRQAREFDQEYQDLTNQQGKEKEMQKDNGWPKQRSRLHKGTTKDIQQPQHQGGPQLQAQADKTNRHHRHDHH